MDLYGGGGGGDGWMFYQCVLVPYFKVQLQRGSVIDKRELKGIVPSG